MKLLVVAAVLGVCLADRLENKYLPPRGNQGAGYGGNSGIGQGPTGFGQGGAGFGHGGAGFGQGGAGFGQGGASFSQGGFGQKGGFGNSGLGGQGFGGASGNAYSGGASGNAYSGGASGNAYGGAGGRSNSADASAQILRSNSDVTAEGFSYDFETSNGIRADAQGVATNGVQSQGSFAYKGDDGQDYSISYTADENGYQPQGAHLPTPPPIPEAILKSLEQNARDEAAGISDDGSYRGEGAGAGGYSSGGSGYSGAGAGYSGAGSSNSGAGSGYSGAGNGGAGFSGGNSFGAAGNSFGAAAGGSFGAGRVSSGSFSQKSFGGAASRQYLAPNRGSGTGNFNSQTGYRY